MAKTKENLPSIVGDFLSVADSIAKKQKIFFLVKVHNVCESVKQQ